MINQDIFLSACIMMSTLGGKIIYRKDNAKRIERFFEHKLVRPLIIFSIAYVSTRKTHLALQIMLAYIVINYVLLGDDDDNNESNKNCDKILS